jgi:hypothetical protein
MPKPPTLAPILGLQLANNPSGRIPILQQNVMAAAWKMALWRDIFETGDQFTAA